MKDSTYPSRLRLFATYPHTCSYLPDRPAVNVFVDPALPPDADRYSTLIDMGFRRSGSAFYRPHCPGCSKCVSVRIPSDRFEPSRIQRRIWRRNTDLQATDMPAAFSEEHFALYRKYLAGRHPGGGMDNPRPEDFSGFLFCAGVETRFHEFRCNGQLVASAVVDYLRQGLSAVYTYFDPAVSARRSFGTFAILWQVEAAKQAGLPWVYLGYWIDGCRKMSYKRHFHPLEGYMGGRWRELAETAV